MGRGKRSCTARDAEADGKGHQVPAEVRLRLPQEFVALGLDGFVRGVAGRRSKQLFYRETAHLFWTKSLCPGTRPQAVVPVVSGSVRVPPRRPGLPVTVSRARRDDADLPRASAEVFFDWVPGPVGTLLSAPSKCVYLRCGLFECWHEWDRAGGSRR